MLMIWSGETVVAMHVRAGFRTGRSATALLRSGRTAVARACQTALFAVVLLATAPVPTTDPVATRPVHTRRAIVRGEHVAAARRVAWHRVSAIALGLNTAPWDSTYGSSGGVDVINPLLRSAGIGLLRYGGGSYADYYDWQTNSNIQNCLPYDATAPFTGGCAASSVLGFDQFSKQTKTIGARSFVTVNYGSGTPSEAAAWVAHSLTKSGDSVALWDVGNETYGCWEVNNWLAKPPASYRGYTPGTYIISHGAYVNPSCPQTRFGSRAGTATLANSYAAHARVFLAAMRKAGPRAELGVPWAFGSNIRGASVPFHAEWDNTVLREDGKYIGFVDAHYYPFSFRGGTGGANPTDQRVLRSLMAVPSQYAQIRAELRRYVPRAGVVIGETGVSPSATTTVCTPAGAVFAAGDVLSWLAAGAVSVDWWDMNNGGNSGATCTNADFGMFTSGSPPVRETPYYGYLLASILARPGALLSAMPTSSPRVVLAYQSRLPGGGEAVAFINTRTRWSQRVRFSPQVRLRGKLMKLSYAAGRQNSTDSRIITGTVSASSLSRGISLPPESIVILKSRHESR
jgi:hypothetical protein